MHARLAACLIWRLGSVWLAQSCRRARPGSRCTVPRQHHYMAAACLMLISLPVCRCKNDVHGEEQLSPLFLEHYILVGAHWIAVLSCARPRHT
jgi:hypothetical protein